MSELTAGHQGEPAARLSEPAKPGSALTQALGSAAAGGAAAGATAAKMITEHGSMGMKGLVAQFGNATAMTVIIFFAFMMYRDISATQKADREYERSERQRDREDRGRDREAANAEIRALTNEIRADREAVRAITESQRSLTAELRGLVGEIRQIATKGRQ